MTDGFSVPGGATPSGSLPGVLTRVRGLADRLGVSHAEVFDVTRLSVASGVPEAVVKDLLSGRPGGEPDLQARFLQRFDLLRRTRLKPNGRRYTQQEIADGAKMSRQQAGALINGDRRPTMEHCAAIQRFFGVHAGFLSAEDADALAFALQLTEQELLQRAAVHERPARKRRPARGSHRPDGSSGPGGPDGPDSGGQLRTPGRPHDGLDDPQDPDGMDDALERLLQDHGVRGIAWRAAQLPTDKHRDKVTEWLDMLLESVKPPHGPTEP
ncbi:helix-turn-helix domain-containing protein [Streptomyces sp. NPDC127068]|uniref:helix-turn-helix domain-containing protein n=1 Tax=Streptomyces sp. NPDC127068 TaxID=3347127 RepID=UPI0036460BE3